ncbi:MAG: DUF1156 domain-containing protein, partial [Planctomycetes bacterium]|nr:DUF1156 domain-containing protein [Planctomycetota bacterium]
GELPPVYDPFSGGGSIPLEAQRLGLPAFGSDLNPVAVMIGKAMIEIPPKFAGRPPVNPESRRSTDLLRRQWRGAEGLADDVRYYGQWMRDEAEKRIGHLYPKVTITDDMVATRPDLEPYRGRALTVIAWVWARTVRSPNPAFKDVAVPLTSTFVLSAKAGQEAWIRPIVEGSAYRFEVVCGAPHDNGLARAGTKLGRGANFACLMSGSPLDATYVRSEAQAGRMGERLLAMIAEGDRRRVYLSPRSIDEATANGAVPGWSPSLEVPSKCHDVDRLPMYGRPTWGDAFSKRQLAALSTFSRLVNEVVVQMQHDARADPHRSSEDLEAYAKAVATYLGLCLGRCANYWSAFTPWGGEFIVQTFGRQAIPMVWDHAEANPMSSSTGNWLGAVDWVAKVLETSIPSRVKGIALQQDAQTQGESVNRVVSTDPPYYDNVGYAELSDFFYVWLRQTLSGFYPDLLATIAVPKASELIVAYHRHDRKEDAEAHFLSGMTQAMRRLAEDASAAFPVTIYYAFKQSETSRKEGTVSTGWETFLDAVIQAGLTIEGTWPVRTERDQGLKSGTNVLASSIVLSCRRRTGAQATASRRQFLDALRAELPAALHHLQAARIAPVDLAQAAIGPGMSVFSRYRAVVESNGERLGVRVALGLINSVLDECMTQQEGDFDADTRWALAWFEEHGFGPGDYGKAETLSTAKVTSVRGIEEAGILASKAGKVRILKPGDLPSDWDPASDTRLTAWECVHHLIRVLESEGEAAAATLVAKLGTHADIARELAYRLYTICERKKWAAEARAYNGLVVSWSAIESLLGPSESSSAVEQKQQDLPGM